MIPCGSKILIAGSTGMIGSALSSELSNHNIISPTSKELDLRDRSKVFAWFEKNKPDFVLNAAAKVGGIRANIEFPVDFILHNLQIQNNLMEACHQFDVKKSLFFGSACSYPKDAAQPIREETMNEGSPEPTNVWYATAKVAGLKLAEAYKRQYNSNILCVVPTNCYGPGDNFDPAVNHVIPALMKRFHLARSERAESVTIWGSGRPKREFIYVKDLAKIVVALFREHDVDNFLNIGPGIETTIYELAQLIARIVGYEGRLLFDHSKPDGVDRKCLDTSKLKSLIDFKFTPLESGLTEMYTWAVNNEKM